MTSKVQAFYADALDQLSKTMDRVQGEFSDVLVAMRHAAQVKDQTSWEQARAHFYTLRANLHQFSEALKAAEELGDEALDVPGYDGRRRVAR